MTNEAITRRKDGSIDYAHYLDIGRTERQRAVGRVFRELYHRIPGHGSTLVVICLVTVVTITV